MKHKNLHTKQYRYKLVEKKSNKVSEVVMHSSGRMENATVYITGKPERKYVPYEYKFYFLLKVFWNIKSWYKRPRKKPNKTISKTKTISKRLSNSIGVVVLAVIGTILSAIIWSEYKEQILILWRNIF